MADTVIKNKRNSGYLREEEEDAVHDPQESIDDECSTDSGCSSGGSTGSAETISHRGSADPINNLDSYHNQLHQNRHHVHFRSRSTGDAHSPATTQLSLPRKSIIIKDRSLRSCSPDEGHCRNYRVSIKTPSRSESPEDPDTAKRSSIIAAKSIRKAFQHLKISTLSSSKQEPQENNKTNSKAQAQPKRILRNPVSYTYAKGLSGLPTQRIPRL